MLSVNQPTVVRVVNLSAQTSVQNPVLNPSVVLLNSPSQPLNQVLQLPARSPVIFLQRQTSEPSSKNCQLVSSSRDAVDSVSVQTTSNHQQLVSNSACTTSVPSDHQTPISSTSGVNVVSTVLQPSHSSSPNPPFLLLNVPTQTSNPILQLPSQNPFLHLTQNPNPILQVLGQNQFSILPPVFVQPSVTVNQPPALGSASIDPVNTTSELSASSCHSSSQNSVIVNSSSIAAEHDYAITSVQSSSSPQQLAFNSTCTTTVPSSHHTPVSSTDVVNTVLQPPCNSSQVHQSSPFLLLNVPTQTSNPILQLPSQNPFLHLTQNPNPILQVLGQNQFSILPPVFAQPSVTVNQPLASGSASSDPVNTTSELSASSCHSSSPNSVIVNSSSIAAEHDYAITSVQSSSSPQQLPLSSACTTDVPSGRQTPVSAVDMPSTTPQLLSSSGQLHPTPPFILLNVPTSNPVIQFPSQNPILQLPQTHNSILQVLGHNQFSILPPVIAQPTVAVNQPPASVLTSIDSVTSASEPAESSSHSSQSSNDAINSTDVTGEPSNKNCQLSTSDPVGKDGFKEAESSALRYQPSGPSTSSVNSCVLNTVLNSLMVAPQPPHTSQLLTPSPSVIMLNLPIQLPNPVIQLPVTGSSPFIVLPSTAVAQSSSDNMPSTSGSVATGGVSEVPAPSAPEGQTSSGADVIRKPSSPNNEPTSSIGGILSNDAFLVSPACCQFQLDSF
jgi:hypothetical protein